MKFLKSRRSNVVKKRATKTPDNNISKSVELNPAILEETSRILSIYLIMLNLRLLEV